MKLLTKKNSFSIFAFFAIAIGVYPSIYFLIDGKFGILNSKTDALLADVIWNAIFYTHITLGGIALLVGWIQFRKKLRLQKINLHRNIGKIYVVSVLLSAIASIYVGYFATGGLISQIGFITLGLIWLYTTLTAFTSIKKGDIITHQKMMIYSYAATFAAVTLRLWLPILSAILEGFLPAYKMVAWLCWVPNLIIAYFIIKKQFKTT